MTESARDEALSDEWLEGAIYARLVWLDASDPRYVEVKQFGRACAAAALLTRQTVAQPPDAEPEPVGWMWLEDGIEEYGAPYELRPGSAVPLYAAPQPPTGSGHESLAGTFDCPVCGKDFPHNHKVDKVGRVIETNDPDTGVNYVWMLRKKRFEDAVKRCTVYSLSPGRGGDDSLYEDKCTNAAHWGYEAAVSIELADAIPREIHERLVAERDAEIERLKDMGVTSAALYKKVAEYPNTCLSVGSWKASLTRFFSSKVHRAPMKESVIYELRQLVEFVKPEDADASDVFDFELPENFADFIADGHLYIRFKKP